MFTIQGITAIDTDIYVLRDPRDKRNITKYIEDTQGKEIPK